MRKSLLLFVLLAALSAGLLAGACAAVQGRREAVSYRAEILAGDPAAADGVELTWVSPAAITCSGTAPFLPPRRRRPKPAFPTPARSRAGSLSWTRMCWSSLPA